MDELEDLDPLSPLIQRVKFCLMGKSRSYVADSQDFAQALLRAAQELERLTAENKRLVEAYAHALTELGEAPRGDA